MLKSNITANQLTFYSLIAGLFAIYFLFDHYWLFVLISVLHLLFDALDGVLARIGGTTKIGKFFDFYNDRLIEFLALIKMGLFLDNYYIFIVAGIFCLTIAIYFISKMSAPIVLIRTITLILLMTVTYPSMPYPLLLVNLIGLIAGITYVYSLIKQGQWIIRKSKKD